MAFVAATGRGRARAQEACITGLNNSAAVVTRAVARRLLSCVKAGVVGELPAGTTAEQCLESDPKGKLAAAQAKTVAAEVKHCVTPPTFGPMTAAEVNEAFGGAIRAHAVFGPDLDAALVSRASDPAGAACQVAAAKGMGKLAMARLRAFNQCKVAGLRNGSIVAEAGLEACFGNDPRGIVSKALARVRSAVEKACAGVSVGAIFPGECAGVPLAQLADCIDVRAECGVCLAINGGDHLIHACHEFEDGVATVYCGDRPSTTQSVARQWDEELLSAIRLDLARPPVHARNLFHVSVALWDAWATADPTADGYVTTEKNSWTDPARDRAIAMSFAAYRVLVQRFQNAPNATTSLRSFVSRMHALGYDPSYTVTTGGTPAAVGNRIGQAVITYGLGDGSNEAGNYADPTYAPVNAPLIVKLPGVTMVDPNRWQPLALDLIIDQSGIPIPDNVQKFIGPQWGNVTPFAANLMALLPGPPPRLHDPVTDDAFKQQALEVIRLASRLTPDDGVTIDISPGAYGNNSLGANDGTGHPVNPISGLPYPPQVVKRGDFGRVLAEFWADGPTSETPPGHWNTLANYVSDHPLVEKRFGGTGPILDDLEWDAKLYFALNGAVHDAAYGCWGTKRVYDSVRPISMIRLMGGLGQSSDPLGTSYHPDGLPLEPGIVEVVTPASSAPGERHEALAGYVGEIAVLSWPGDPADPLTQYSGVRWVRAKEWVPYQRKTFVTPPFAAYTSGHSTYSRSAAEVLTAFTGSPYFPGGLGEFVAPQNGYLVFELGPSTDVRLQWATYYDAADQAGQSRLWGGIHILADDFGGRIMGAAVGGQAFAKALTYFDGTAVP
jgi:hypothetical protein